MFRKFLVPTDGSEHSMRAAAQAVTLAQQVGGSMIAMAVIEPYPFPPISESPFAGGSAAYDERARALAEEHLAQVSHAAQKANVPCETLAVDGLYPNEEIVAAAQKRGCDAIVMGTHGRKGVSKLFAGSVTQKVFAQASVPVIVVRE